MCDVNGAPSNATTEACFTESSRMGGCFWANEHEYLEGMTSMCLCPLPIRRRMSSSTHISLIMTRDVRWRMLAEITAIMAAAVRFTFAVDLSVILMLGQANTSGAAVSRIAYRNFLS